MEKSKKSKPSTNNKQKQIIDSDSGDDDDDNNKLSSHSTLSINPDEPVVNNIAHNLFILAIKKARQERQQAKIRQQKNSKLSTNSQRQTISVKKKQLTIADIDRLFEEKRLRPSNIKNDLFELYQKSTGRVRSMLDIHQIEQFIQTTQNRKII